MQIIPKQTSCEWLEFVNSDFLETLSCLVAISRLAVSFLVACLQFSCQRNLGWIWCRQKLFSVASDVTGAGRLSTKCTWAKQYIFHKFKALWEKPPASAVCGLRSSEVCEWGVLEVTRGWHEPECGPSAAGWHHPWGSAGNSRSCFSSPCARQSWHLLHPPAVWKGSSESIVSVFWDPTTCG